MTSPVFFSCCPHKSLDYEAWESKSFDIDLPEHYLEEDSASTISGISDDGGNEEVDMSDSEMEWTPPTSHEIGFALNQLVPSKSPEVSAIFELPAENHLHTAPSVPGLNDMPDELLFQVSSFLNVRDLKRARALNTRFRALMSLDQAGWTHHCLDLWRRKVHVPALFARRLQAPTSSALELYRLSCMDAQKRTEIKPEELCYDPHRPSTVFSFRFKESAGPEWTSFDPWHNGRGARQMVFLRDGTVRQLVVEGDNNISLRLPFFDATDSMGLQIRWKFVRKPIDLPVRPQGAYVRLNVGGRDVPTYVVQRSPNGNWGFLLENCWGVFASFDLPRKTERSLRRQMQDDSGPRKRQKTEDVLGDSSLTVTNNWQWREAFLYNLGASTLPDEEQHSNLERAWDDAAMLGLAGVDR